MNACQACAAENETLIPSSILTLTGTNTGPIGTLPPTGKKVRYTAISVVYLKNGKTAKEIAIYNVLEMLEQMGFKVSPPQAAK